MNNFYTTDPIVIKELVATLYDINQSVKNHSKDFYNFIEGNIVLNFAFPVGSAMVFLKKPDEILGKGKKNERIRNTLQILQDLSFTLNSIEFYRYINSEGKTTEFSELTIRDGSLSLVSQFSGFHSPYIPPLSVSQTITDLVKKDDKEDSLLNAGYTKFSPTLGQNLEISDASKKITLILGANSVILPNHILFLGRNVEKEILNKNAFSLFWKKNKEDTLRIILLYEYPFFSIVASVDRVLSNIAL